ncbi:MAG: carboxylesterase family protein [Candidatus Acidiferrales bacterium]
MKYLAERRKAPMRGYFRWSLAAVLGLALANPRVGSVSSGSPGPTVRLESGVLEGTQFGSSKNEVAFLGVPYASPPVGDLRWKPPQPVSKWKGTRKATKFAAVCPQLPAAWLPTLPWNEDCLYLNVWTTQVFASAKLPVIIYFHGGSNTAGYSQLTPLGPSLSRAGVVVVSANYRLGPLGFIAYPALTAESEHHSSGNYGLLDQLQALKWVRENISRFGGDPRRITVMGQSAGAVDICLLMVSPLAAGLFQRAIMESGDCQGVFNEDIRTPIRYNEISGTGEGAGERLANDLGVADGRDTLLKLRSIPADEILKAWSKNRKIHFDAIVDGWIIPEQPAKIFAEAQQVLVPVLVGSNANEATVFGHNDLKTVDQYKNYLMEDTGKYSDQEFQVYPATSDVDVPGQSLQLENDSFAYGAYSMVRTMTRAGQKAYLYYFTYVETGKRAPLGAYHGLELKFLSGEFPSDWQHSQDDEKLGAIIRTYWSQFAKTGDPNPAGIPEWPAYDAHADQCLDLGRPVGSRPVPHAAQLLVLEHIMKQIFAETWDVQVQTGATASLITWMP